MEWHINGSGCIVRPGNGHVQTKPAPATSSRGSGLGESCDNKVARTHVHVHNRNGPLRLIEVLGLR